MVIQNQYRAIMQYSFTKGKIVTDWYCVKVSTVDANRQCIKSIDSIQFQFYSSAASSISNGGTTVSNATHRATNAKRVAKAAMKSAAF